MAIKGTIINSNTKVLNATIKTGAKGADGQDGADGQGYEVAEFLDFTGELSTAKDFQPYNDYTGAEIANLTFSADKKRGATGNVRIKGGSIATDAIPTNVTVLPASITLTTDVNQWNELDYQYLSDTHIRMVVSVLDSNFQPINTGTPSEPTITYDAVINSPTASTGYTEGDSVSVQATLTASSGTPNTTKTELINTANANEILATNMAAPFDSFAWDSTGTTGSVSLAVRWYVDDVLVETSDAVNITVNTAASFEYLDYVANSGVTIEGDGTIRRTTETQAGNYTKGARGTKAMSGDNSILFSADPDTAYASIGVTNTYSYSSGTFGINMDLAVILDDDTASKKLLIFENGSQTFSLTNGWALSDVYEIELIGTTVAVKRNGSTVFTSAQTFTKPLNSVVTFSDTPGLPKIINARFTNPTNLQASTI